MTLGLQTDSAVTLCSKLQTEATAYQPCYGSSGNYAGALDTVDLEMNDFVLNHKQSCLHMRLLTASRSLKCY